MISGSFWNYYGNEMNAAANEDAADYRINNSKTTAIKSFEYYNTKLRENTR